jgi:hypothetical protein
MTQPNKPKAPVMFAPDTESVLVRGLNAMTRACDALSEQNEILNRDIEGMKKKIARLQERVILNEGSKE